MAIPAVLMPVIRNTVSLGFEKDGKKMCAILVVVTNPDNDLVTVKSAKVTMRVRKNSMRANLQSVVLHGAVVGRTFTSERAFWVAVREALGVRQPTEVTLCDST